MARIAIAIAAALLFTTTVSAASRIGESSETPSVEQKVFASSKNAKKTKTTKDESLDYLVVTLSDAG